MARFVTRTFRILECTTASDYNALSAAKKDAYKMILSCGLIDMDDNAPMKIMLWNIFDEGTDTRINLEGLSRPPDIEAP